MDTIRVELPIVESSSIVSKCKRIGDLKRMYPKLSFVKYIYLDPLDNKLKGVNPPDDSPVVPGAYITVMGELDEIIKFATAATKSVSRLA